MTETSLLSLEVSKREGATTHCDTRGGEEDCAGGREEGQRLLLSLGVGGGRCTWRKQEGVCRETFCLGCPAPGAGPLH